MIPYIRRVTIVPSASHLVPTDGAFDAGVLQVFRCFNDGEELRQLVPLSSFFRVAVQGHLILRDNRTKTRGRRVSQAMIS